MSMDNVIEYNANIKINGHRTKALRVHREPTSEYGDIKSIVTKYKANVNDTVEYNGYKYTVTNILECDSDIMNGNYENGEYIVPITYILYCVLEA